VRRRLTVLTVLALLTAALAAPAAEAASARVCARQAVLRDAPRGFIVAYLRRGTVVRVVRRSADGRSVAVRTRQGRAGWLSTAALCLR